jgi:Carboxypeptidase regulatory-like domain
MTSLAGAEGRDRPETAAHLEGEGMGALRRILLIAALSILLPASAYAQATLAGVVKDASEAVLPGATVEASSSALIEKTRRTVTDSSGQYRITELPPGIYEITYSLLGFATVRREGVEVTGSGVIAINIEMRVGNVSETLTVTGETPIVDTQTTRRETVLSNATINVLPVSRGYGALLAAIPAMMTSGTDQVFSAQTTPQMTMFTTHGGRANEGRVMVDGLNTAAAFNGGGVSTLTYDVSNAQEMQVLLSGGLGESETGGPSVNLVAPSGSNTFRGTAFWNQAGSWSSADNVDDELRNLPVPITRGPAVVNAWDLSGSLGGPIKRDRLWFFGTVRSYGTARPLEGLFANANAGDPTKWDYVEDRNVEARTATSRMVYEGRLTAQITPRNKVNASYHYENRCDGSSLLTASVDGACRNRDSDWVALGSTIIRTAPEASANYLHPYYNVTQLTWSSPVSNRVLFEAGYSRFHYIPAIFDVGPDALTDVIRVTEVTQRYGAANFPYRGIDTWNNNEAEPHNWRASVAYVSGAHNMKFGYQGAYLMSDTTTLANSNQMTYQFTSPLPGPLVPTQLTIRIAPWQTRNRTAFNAVFVQDQWTMKRLTLQGALRYDHAWSFSPAEHQGTPVASRFNAQPISFPRTVGVTGYDDITPRFGAAYDLFGNGKTALKVNAGKYLQAATNDENYTINNPANDFGAGARFVTSTSRPWTDGNGNKVPDCDLMNQLRQNNLATGGDDCGQWNNLNFGNTAIVTTTINPAILEGWGVRPWDWQFGVSIQQEVLPRVSLEVGYNRRWWGNYVVTDNLTRNPEDYDYWTINAPLNPNLPGGGGYPVTYTDLEQAKFGQPSRNYVTFETDYGPERTAYWHGIDLTANVRLRNGLTFQGGTSTGRGVRNYCDVAAKLPEMFDPVLGTRQLPLSCDVTEEWATSMRGIASYTLPKVDVLISALVRSQGSNFPNVFATSANDAATNGTSLSANYPVPNTVVRQALGGRLPSGAVPNPNGTTSVNLLRPGQLYGHDQVTQVDMRVAKILRFGGRRTTLGLDLYNLFNTNDWTIYNSQFGTDGSTWYRPTAIVAPRFARFNVSVDF